MLCVSVPGGSTASILQSHHHARGQESSLKDSLKASLQCSIFPLRAKCWQTAENPQALHVFSLSLNMLVLQNKILKKTRSVVIHLSPLSGEPPPCLALAGTQASGQIPDKCKSLEHKPVSIGCPLPNAVESRRVGAVLNRIMIHNTCTTFVLFSTPPPPSPGPVPSAAQLGREADVNLLHRQHPAGDIHSQHCRESLSALWEHPQLQVEQQGSEREATTAAACQ